MRERTTLRNPDGVPFLIVQFAERKMHGVNTPRLGAFFVSKIARGRELFPHGCRSCVSKATF